MQKRIFEQHTSLAMALLMGKRTDSKGEGTVRFRPQIDRRQVAALAQGTADRRARRTATPTDRVTVDHAASGATSVRKSK
jgi:hypothetical protein